MIERISKKNRHWLELYLGNLKQHNKSAHTLKNYRADLLKFILWFQYTCHPRLEKTNGDSIGLYKDFLSSGGVITPQKPSLVKRWFIACLFWRPPVTDWCYQQSPLSVGSRRRHLSAIKNFFEFLKQAHEDKSKLFFLNPVKSKLHGIKLKSSDVVPTKMLYFDDWEKLKEKTYRTDERLIIYLLYWGGLRLEELSNLKVDDFDLKRRMIQFKRKGGDLHELLLQKRDYIFEQLEFYLENIHQCGEYIFQGRLSARPLTTRAMANKILKILKRAEVSTEITPHSFRKACATNLYRRTKDLILVRDYLNHSDAKVTQTYIDKEVLQKEGMFFP